MLTLQAEAKTGFLTPSLTSAILLTMLSPRRWVRFLLFLFPCTFKAVFHFDLPAPSSHLQSFCLCISLQTQFFGGALETLVGIDKLFVSPE